MALRALCGFETGSITDSGLTGGSGQSISSVTVRSGVYSLRSNPVTTATNYFSLNFFDANGIGTTPPNIATTYISFYFCYATPPASGSEEFLSFLDSGASYKLSLRLTSTGAVQVYNAAGTQLGSDSSALSANRWYRLDVKCGTSATIGPYELKIDDTSIVSGTGNTGSSNLTYCLLGKFTNRSSQTTDVYYDDVMVSDSAFTASGPYYIKALQPIGNGNYTAWTGTYTDVADVPPDDDTTYISSSTSGQAETAVVQSATTAGIVGTVLAVATIARCRENASFTPGGIQVRLRSGTTDNDTAMPGSQAIGTNYSYLGKYYETDPATGAAWTIGALAALEVGVEMNASNASRCTQLLIMVVYQVSQGPNYPSASANDATVGTETWGGLTNVYANDGNNAFNFVGGTSLISKYLTCTGYGFSIPSSAVINGIVAEIKKGTGLGAVNTDYSVRIIKGGAIGSVNKAKVATFTGSTAFSTYGDSTDLWGESWTYSDINASNFGIAFSVQGSVTILYPLVDTIRITVYYTLTPPADALYLEDATSGILLETQTDFLLLEPLITSDPQPNRRRTRFFPSRF